jgi:hypothetical protein
VSKLGDLIDRGAGRRASVTARRGGRRWAAAGGTRPAALFSTDPAVTAEEALSAVADRFSIEQDFHDLKEVEGLGQQQGRDIWATVGDFHVSAWVHTLIELWV